MAICGAHLARIFRTASLVLRRKAVSWVGEAHSPTARLYLPKSFRPAWQRQVARLHCDLGVMMWGVGRERQWQCRVNEVAVQPKARCRRNPKAGRRVKAT